MPSPTCPRLTPSKAHGFTLIEIILTVSIIILLLGFLFLSLRNLSLESRLRSDLQEISDLARATRFRAISQRLPWLIEFQADRLTSLPPAHHTPPTETAAQTVHLPPTLTLKLRTSPDQPWSPPEGHLWRFDPSGVVGPLHLRLTREGASVEVEVDTLTGRFLETARHLP